MSAVRSSRHGPHSDEPITLDRGVEQQPIDRPPHAQRQRAVAAPVAKGLVVELVHDDLALAREAAGDHQPGRAHRVIARRDTDVEEDIGVILDHQPIEAADSSCERDRTSTVAKVEPLVRRGRRRREHLDLVAFATQRLHLLHGVCGDAVSVGRVRRHDEDAAHGRVHSCSVASTRSSTSSGA